MTRPLTTYLISIWLTIWLIGIPLSSRDLLVYQFGPYLTALFLLSIILAALVINFQVLRCHPAYIDLALGILSLQLGYLLTRFIWLMLHEGFAGFPVAYLIILGVNFYCVSYLMLPATQARIRRARAALLTGRTQPPPEGQA